MRTFNNKDKKVLLNAFGESLQLSSGVSIMVLHEQLEVVFEEMVSTEKYFSCAVEDISINSQFIINGKTFVVRKITDDFSGIVNVYYEAIQ
ncbi:hypothetical protein ACXKU5_002845 [Yersinia enterocolitica]|uniref:Uncharacterized protein n=2 Tax=Yersinia TaxID=629 RepID=A0A0T9TP88_YERAE|nr:MULTISPECIES: hypothetical protein [Yersinia]AKF37316.1 hypothetical protein FORC2_1169 [Yersinia enterocolitica]ALG46090.1 hypothetical protein LI89_15610 [Yersinia enterocolitica]EKN4073621.1 hypothetical protein [Yersinia enterocolitica]EKN4144128.1 hypothetical protein [Yersinia enterocolitica]EKN4193812.1 hypothetical protein [Yersinia enterocolitica]